MVYPALGLWAQAGANELRFQGVRLARGCCLRHGPSAATSARRFPSCAELPRASNRPRGRACRLSACCWRFQPRRQRRSHCSPPGEPHASTRLTQMPRRAKQAIYIDAAAAGKKAIEMFDTDKDGKLSGKELDKCPGLKSACVPTATGGASTVDPAGTGRDYRRDDHRPDPRLAGVEARADVAPLHGRCTTAVRWTGPT